MAFASRYGSLMALLLLCLASCTFALDMAYCASINTASMSANLSTYQSDGLCYGFCNDKSYAFAVLQDKSCWCSNYVPDSSDQVSTSKCDMQCPGYPSDTCGGTGLYGYISLSASASGTLGAGSSTAQSSAGSGSSGTTYVATVTEGGTVSLQTVTVMPSGTDAASSSGVSTEHTGLSTGAAVGIAVGILGFVAVLVAIGVYLWLRRRRRNREQEALENQTSFRGSSAGMMSTPRTEMASVWDGEAQSAGRRNSRMMPHDPRMDPYATNIYGRFENKSHESVATLRDDQDYSRRVLRTTNPDPADE